MTTKLKILVMSAAVLALAACANGQPDKATIGAGIGAVGGAVLGHQLGDHSATNTAVGTILGGAIGGAVGNRMDQQDERYRREQQYGYGEGGRYSDGYNNGYGYQGYNNGGRY